MAHEQERRRAGRASRRLAPRGPEQTQAPASAGDPGEADCVLPYTPPPLLDPPLCVPLPPRFFHDPGYRPFPYAYAGCSEPPGQFGVIGNCLRAGEQVAMDYGGCFAHGYFGPPGSGKTYIEGVHLEAALLSDHYLGRLPAPLCGVSVSYGRGAGGGHAAEQLMARLPNQDPREVRALIHGHGTLPRGFPDVVALCPRRLAPALRRAHPGCQVLGLAFSCQELGAAGLQALMAMDERGGSLLDAEIGALLAALPRGFALPDLRAAIAEYPFRDRRLRQIAARRVDLAAELIDDRASLRALVRPGRLLIMDLRDGWLASARALTILRVALSILTLGDGPPPCGLLLCLDEAHKLLLDPALRLQIEHLIRERRHLGLSVVLLSQDPAEVPHSTLAELDGVGLFSTGSARALRHLGRAVHPFSQVAPPDLAALRPGQMLLWSRRWLTPYAPGELDGMLVRIEVRPRLSHHGGATRGALSPGDRPRG